MSINKLSKTKELLRKLIKQHRETASGRPITDGEIRLAYKEMDKLENQYSFSKRLAIAFGCFYLGYLIGVIIN